MRPQIVLLSIAVALSACAPPPGLRGDTLSGPAFDRLADNDVVDFGEKEYRVQEVREQIAAIGSERAAWDRTTAAAARSTLDSLQEQQKEEDRAALARVNAEADAEIARLSRSLAPQAAHPRLDTGPVTITPGQRVVIAGADLGAQRGELRLVFSSPRHRFLPLNLAHWTAGWVAATLPSFPHAGAAGEPDQRAALELVTHDGHLLRWPVAFRAMRTVAVVTIGDAEQCAAAGYHDVCRVGPNVTLMGTHGVLFRDRGATGTDRAHISLANGWSTLRLDQAVWRWGYTSAGGDIQNVDGCATGCRHTDLTVRWRIPADYYGGLHYVLRLYVSGPRGVGY